jgi:hypothetical protein
MRTIPALLEVLTSAIPVVIRFDDTRLRTVFSVIIVYIVVAGAFISTAASTTTGAERENPYVTNSASVREQAAHSNVRLEKRSIKVFEYKMTGISIRVLKKITVPIPAR